MNNRICIIEKTDSGQEITEALAVQRRERQEKEK